MAPAFDQAYSQPDWVMCGMSLPEGGVRLITSQQLNRAELQALFRRMSTAITLSTEMATCTVIDAPDYPTAFQNLFAKWNPQSAPRPGITEGQREISA
jgi:hypothetical protein